MDAQLEHLDARTALELLKWQVELGVDEVISATPVNRYAPPPVPKQKERIKGLDSPPLPMEDPLDPVAVAEKAAKDASNLGELEDALAAYSHCELKKGARSLVFADGRPEARVMIIGEAPGREEDLQGKPFVGQAGQLLDRMLAAIGLARDHVDATSAVYITNVLPWRPPQNRDPKPEEVAMMMPFLTRHVELIAPDFIILMGNHACQAALGRKGITRLRGTWVTAFGHPALPMFHPAYLLRNPQAKREAWVDLLALQEKTSP